ncbi:hypothetical protein BDP27DRAFT_1320458 [Rhodocollybia butyracea]|uniref:Uncharacterized protein n=1 Tax=Rhodocollybia butyracea TaxID=206335 RepID=A0A9P5UBT1_9AGAR|nr:hypothetical protein BDP27DRAFT_1320458 [Rhodocollybia butyracea]
MGVLIRTAVKKGMEPQKTHHTFRPKYMDAPFELRHSTLERPISSQTVHLSDWDLISVSVKLNDQVYPSVLLQPVFLHPP